MRSAGSRAKQTRRRARQEAPATIDLEVDGCDIEFKDQPFTDDADLPPARGGVEVPVSSRRKRRKRA